MQTVEVVFKLLDLAVAGSLTYERATQAKAQIDAIVAEGRDPTSAEWDSLFAESDELDLRLDAADKKE